MKKPTVLLSAMHLEDKSILDRLNITGNAIVINQCDKASDETIKEASRTVRFVSSKERGLSKSRNLAMSLAEDGICLYCDNDVKYRKDYESRIMSAYERHPDADIIVFFIRRPEREKPVIEGDAPLGYLKSMKIFSPEISFKKESLSRVGLKMDEDFGAGARFGMGEENIFLFDAKRLGLSARLGINQEKYRLKWEEYGLGGIKTIPSKLDKYDENLNLNNEGLGL